MNGLSIMPTQPGATRGVWLRCDSVSGGKDWICFILPQGIETHWGKTGEINQSNLSEQKRFSTIYAEKIRKGYYQIASWDPQSGSWIMAGEQPPLAQPATVSAPVVPRRARQKKQPAEAESVLVNWVSATDAQEWF